jgi:hypothetical protein
MRSPAAARRRRLRRVEKTVRSPRWWVVVRQHRLRRTHELG